MWGRPWRGPRKAADSDPEPPGRNWPPRPSGADPDQLLFRRETYDRKQKEPKGTWSRAELSRTMAETCATAELEPLVFHELRHTYASGPVNRGAPWFLWPWNWANGRFWAFTRLQLRGER